MFSRALIHRRGVARPGLLAALVTFSGGIFFLATQSCLRSSPCVSAPACQAYVDLQSFGCGDYPTLARKEYAEELGLTPEQQSAARGVLEEADLLPTGMIGAILESVPSADGYIRVRRTIRSMPATRGDLRSEDLISKVDGRSVAGMAVEDVVDLIIGEPNTPVNLTIVREGWASPIELNFVRQAVVRGCRTGSEADLDRARAAIDELLTGEQKARWKELLGERP